MKKKLQNIQHTKEPAFDENEESGLNINDEVDLLITDETGLGFSAKINGTYSGLIYHNEIFQEIHVGDTLKGYIKNIREDNKIDLKLQRTGYKHIEPNSNKILVYLKKNAGFMPLHDKSDPNEITRVLQMSKKNFKKAIGGLYKQRLIRIADDGIYLL